MARIFLLIAAFLITPHISRADVYSDFYFAAKRSVVPDLFQRADYIKSNFGSPFVFPEKFIRAYDVIGIAGQYGVDIYSDETIEPWTLELTDLAIHVVHVRTLLRAKGITTSVWREGLIAYEDAQLDRIRQGLPLDPLNNLRDTFENPHHKRLLDAVYYDESSNCGDRSSRGYETVEYHTCKPLELAKLNQRILGEVISTGSLSEAETIFAELIMKSFEYIFERSDQRLAFLVWEPSCECGNGFFSIKIALEYPEQSIDIASEFAFRVCQNRLSIAVKNLADCLGTHSLGTGQSVYLSGDYRYQITDSSGNVGRLKSIQLRGADIDGRTLRFIAAGHEIVE